ncbi:MAG: hypothetical protein AAF098_04630, partial [Pseudomonadota bacterium]
MRFEVSVNHSHPLRQPTSNDRCWVEPRLRASLGVCLAVCLMGALSNAAVAVDCPSTDYSFTSQSEVNAFEPLACDTVTGNLTINGADVTDLSPLQNLSTVNGFMFIGVFAQGQTANALLTNVDGLSGLTAVGSFLSITANTALENLDGLTNLTTVDRLFISANPLLDNLDGLQGLSGSIGNSLWVYDNPLIRDLDGLSGISGELVVNLRIYNSASLQNVDGLAGLAGGVGNLFFSNNPLLTNLDALGGITSVAGNLTMDTLPLLQDLAGLSALAGDIGGSLVIARNTALDNLDALNGLTSVATA